MKNWRRRAPSSAAETQTVLGRRRQPRARPPGRPDRAAPASWRPCRRPRPWRRRRWCRAGRSCRRRPRRRSGCGRRRRETGNRETPARRSAAASARGPRDGSPRSAACHAPSRSPWRWSVRRSRRRSGRARRRPRPRQAAHSPRRLPSWRGRRCRRAFRHARAQRSPAPRRHTRHAPRSASARCWTGFARSRRAGARPRRLRFHRRWSRSPAPALTSCYPISGLALAPKAAFRYPPGLGSARLSIRHPEVRA